MDANAIADDPQRALFEGARAGDKLRREWSVKHTHTHIHAGLPVHTLKTEKQYNVGLEF